jgi:hypothetical protein
MNLFFVKTQKALCFNALIEKESYYICTGSEEPTPQHTTPPTRPKQRRDQGTYLAG